MNRNLTKELFRGFRSTPILATLIFILGLCMALDYSVKPRGDLSLFCHSDIYDAKQSMFFSSGLKLAIRRVGDRIEFNIAYIQDGNELAYMTTYGELIEISAPILTYEIRLKGADLKYYISLDKIDGHGRETLRIVKDSINSGNTGKGKPFYIKVLEMDQSLGIAVIQVSERNALWACKVQ